MLRNYWLSLSFANLVYLRAWTDLIPASPDNAFFRKTLAGYSLYFGVATDVLILSFLTFLVVSIAPKLPGWLQRVLPVIAVAMLAMTARSLGGDSIRSGLIVEIVGALLLVLAVLGVWFQTQAVKVIRAVALAATPCLAVTFLGSPYYLSGQRPMPPDPPLAKRLEGSPPVRVMWILFDDWDERLTFPDRAAGTRLPAIDDLSIRSFHATRALAVEAFRKKLYDMATYEAVPALLYGKFLIRADAEDALTQRLRFVPPAGSIGAEDTEVLGGPGNIFQRARARGLNTAAAGWYLPYCRIFGPQLTDCYWDIRYIQTYSASHDFVQGAIDETRMLFETSAFSPFGPALVDAHHFEEYQAVLADARRYAADPSIGLAFIHFNIPHAPYFYDPKMGPSLRYGYQGAMYSEALQVADRAMGDILASIHAAGLDGKTAIILSSDHPFRSSQSGDLHVPFIVHLPGDNTSMVWNEEFSTVLTADLAMAISGGDVRSTADVAGFVRARPLK